MTISYKQIRNDSKAMLINPGGEVLSVAQVIAVIKEVLQSSLPRIEFEGELGPVTRASSGHLYFTVKDPDTAGPHVLNAVMWRGAAQKLTFKPQEGGLVRLVGEPSLYPGSGRFQIVAQSMEPGGDGALRKRFEQLRLQLASEGLFELERKRPLPFFPKSVGVVTSRTGSVLHDIAVALQERMPVADVVLAHARVQGDGAYREVVQAIRALNEEEAVEVIIVARGGGSLEDLWTFNEEAVVRAIFASRKPIVSAVGHETDTTLADLVADVRAATPTAAVRAVVPDKRELLKELVGFERRLLGVVQVVRDEQQRCDVLVTRLQRSLIGRLEAAQLKVAQYQLRLQRASPQSRLEERRRALAQRGSRLREAVRTRMLGAKLELEGVRPVLRERLAGVFILATQQMEQLRWRVMRAQQQVLEPSEHRLTSLRMRWEALDPMKIVERGYVVLERISGGVVCSIAEVSASETLRARMKDGHVVVSVQELVPAPISEDI
jgi:exodeoxyribonuclease VII large subunit